MATTEELVFFFLRRRLLAASCRCWKVSVLFSRESLLQVLFVGVLDNSSGWLLGVVVSPKNRDIFNWGSLCFQTVQSTCFLKRSTNLSRFSRTQSTVWKKILEVKVGQWLLKFFFTLLARKHLQSKAQKVRNCVKNAHAFFFSYISNKSSGRGRTSLKATGHEYHAKVVWFFPP